MTINLFALGINDTLGWRFSISVIDMKEGEMQFITVELIYLIGAKCMEHEDLQ